MYTNITSQSQRINGVWSKTARQLGINDTSPAGKKFIQQLKSELEKEFLEGVSKDIKKRIRERILELISGNVEKKRFMT